MPLPPRIRQRRPALESLEGRRLLNARFGLDRLDPPALAPGFQALDARPDTGQGPWHGGPRHDASGRDAMAPGPFGGGFEGPGHSHEPRFDLTPDVWPGPSAREGNAIPTRGMLLVPLPGGVAASPDGASSPGAPARTDGLVRIAGQPNALPPMRTPAIRPSEQPGTDSAPAGPLPPDVGPLALPAGSASVAVVVPPAPADLAVATLPAVVTRATTLTVVRPLTPPAAPGSAPRMPQPGTPGGADTAPPAPAEAPVGRVPRSQAVPPVKIDRAPIEAAVPAVPQGSDLLGTAPPLDGNALDALLAQLLGGLDESEEPATEQQAGIFPELFVATVTLTAAESARRWRERRRTVPSVPTWNPGGLSGRSRRT